MWKYKIIVYTKTGSETVFYGQDQINALNEHMSECVRKGWKFKVTSASAE